MVSHSVFHFLLPVPRLFKSPQAKSPQVTFEELTSAVGSFGSPGSLYECRKTTPLTTPPSTKQLDNQAQQQSTNLVLFFNKPSAWKTLTSHYSIYVEWNILLSAPPKSLPKSSSKRSPQKEAKKKHMHKSQKLNKNTKLWQFRNPKPQLPPPKKKKNTKHNPPPKKKKKNTKHNPPQKKKKYKTQPPPPKKKKYKTQPPPPKKKKKIQNTTPPQKKKKNTKHNPPQKKKKKKNDQHRLDSTRRLRRRLPRRRCRSGSPRAFGVEGRNGQVF